MMSISPEELKRKLEAGKPFVLFDVREEDERAYSRDRSPAMRHRCPHPDEANPATGAGGASQRSRYRGVLPPWGTFARRGQLVGWARGSERIQHGWGDRCMVVASRSQGASLLREDHDVSQPGCQGTNSRCRMGVGGRASGVRRQSQDEAMIHFYNRKRMFTTINSELRPIGEISDRIAHGAPAFLQVSPQSSRLGDFQGHLCPKKSVALCSVLRMTNTWISTQVLGATGLEGRKRDAPERPFGRPVREP